MPARRKYPLLLVVDGNPIQVRSVGNSLFQSKSMYYNAYYDLSGQLIGKPVEPSPVFDTEKPTGIG
ncbi:hypothetical protein [Spirosoma agri]|uniref:Uncharacterized protein n=1 Tax=Spirosoma agri TaxID=1987381 RepID=A0A6M0IG53_9BACT|nr:hypothetical protein [Spirosoma agri]NEU66725.1 hypothetical protein [Spirosoma agri]